ncbi:MAG: integration host factor, actinobacterial type [Actinomycetota bacterium]
MTSPRSATQTPERSLSQRMDALKRANEIRTARAQLKKDLKTGNVTIQEIIASPPEYVMTAKVFDMLMAVPKCGKVKATRFLNHCRISQGKTMGGLSERQRNELLELLDR